MSLAEPQLKQPKPSDNQKPSSKSDPPLSPTKLEDLTDIASNRLILNELGPFVGAKLIDLAYILIWIDDSAEFAVGVRPGPPKS